MTGPWDLLCSIGYTWLDAAGFQMVHLRLCAMATPLQATSLTFDCPTFPGADERGQLRTVADSRGQLLPAFRMVARRLTVNTCRRNAVDADSADSCFPYFFSTWSIVFSAAPPLLATCM